MLTKLEEKQLVEWCVKCNHGRAGKNMVEIGYKFKGQVEITRKLAETQVGPKEAGILVPEVVQRKRSAKCTLHHRRPRLGDSVEAPRGAHGSAHGAGGV